MNLEIAQAERTYDLNRAAELKYGTLHNLQVSDMRAGRLRPATLGSLWVAMRCSTARIRAWDRCLHSIYV